MAYKRKFIKGEPITSLDELSKQKFVYLFNKITPNGWFMSWQLRLTRHYIERGVLFYAKSTSNDMKEGLEYSNK